MGRLLACGGGVFNGKIDLDKRLKSDDASVRDRVLNHSPRVFESFRISGASQHALPLLSVVAPCYNEAESLAEFWRRTSDACQRSVSESHEIILVDDGSRDGTWSMIEELSALDPHLIGIRLMRNHGHQLAATAGLAVAQGSRVLLIDADLQDPPEMIPSMMALMDSGADVVYGKRSVRHGENWFKLTTAFLFYRFLSYLADIPIPRDAGDFRLMTRRVVDILNTMPERHRFLRGMVSWIGGRQLPLEYERQARFAGSTKYPLRKMVRFAVDAVTSFSTKPLRVAVWLGLAVSLLAFGLLFYVLFRWATDSVIPGWASSAFAQALFAGTQLLVLGTMGEYLGRMVEDTKGRPIYLIDSVVSQTDVFEPSMRKSEINSAESVGTAPSSRDVAIPPMPIAT
jgi:glycosyltransferase involved in cell wall biosynthesis